MGLFAKLKEGLSKTRAAFSDKVNNVFKSFSRVDEELFDELEETLIMADIGVDTASYMIETLRARVKAEKLSDPMQVRDALCDIIRDILASNDTSMHLDTTPSVILIIGVNGVGKTTAIGKLASRYRKEGKKVLLAAADTFRAAAIDQLGIWAQRAVYDISRHRELPALPAVLSAALRVLCVWWAHAPPHLPLFMDPVTGQYGI